MRRSLAPIWVICKAFRGDFETSQFRLPRHFRRACRLTPPRQNELLSFISVRIGYYLGWSSYPGFGRLKLLLPLLFVVLSAFSACGESEWPQFRGPDGQGHAGDGANIPIAWSETDNIHWKCEIPGRGWSSPVISGDQIWLTTATQDGRSLRAICVSHATGQITHNIEVFRRDQPEPVHSQNSHATPTPVIDGPHVFVHFGTNGTAALDRGGNIVWRNDEHQYRTPHGSANSPVLHDDLLIICCDGEDRQFVAAMNRSTGTTVWRRDRSHMEDARRKSRAEQNEGRKGLPFIAFSTPLIVEVNDVPILISTPADHVVANRVDTGEEVWWLPFNCFSLVARPVAGDNLVYAIGGLRDGHYALYAIPLDSAGKLGEEDLAWQRTETIPQCPSPLLLGERLFLIKDSGIATCLNAVTGEALWQKRIGGNFRASPIAAGQRIYFTSQEGTTTVLSPGDQFRQLAANSLDGLFLASPAVAGNALFLRSDSHLYRIEAP